MRNEKGQFVKGHTPPHKGKNLSEEGKQNIIDAHRRPDYKGKGENHYNWQGGKVGERRVRLSWQYRELREATFKRDGYKCVMCGENNLKSLRFDHIKPFYYFPDLRLDIDNCRTLCRKCDFKHGFNYNRDKAAYE